MTFNRAFYDVLIDGGAAGTHMLRGGFVVPQQWIYIELIVIRRLFTSIAGTTIDLGWVSNPTAVFAGSDPTVDFGAGPAPMFSPGPVPTTHAANYESLVLTVHGPGLTDGLLELALMSLIW
jgi:hypothetical protein